MRLKSARLMNYRMHRNLSVDFDRDLTVFGGPNEAGKSTLVEAIHRAFFIRHKTDVGLDKIRPRGSGAAPEVVVEFEAQGRAYTLRKVFNGKTGSLATLTSGGSERHDGDKAEEELHRILGVKQLPAKGKQNVLIQWSHLWVWQGSASNDPTSTGVLNAAAGELRKRLTGLVGGNLAESGRDSETFKRIIAAHELTFRDDGTPRNGSDLFAARQHRDTCASAVATVDGQLHTLELAANTILHEDEVQRTHQGTLATSENDLAVSANELAEVDRLERTFQQQEGTAKAAADAYQKLNDDDVEIRRVREELTALHEKVKPQEQEAATLLAHERRSQQAASQAATSLTTANKEQQESSAQRDLVHAIDRAFNLSSQKGELDRKQKQVAALESVVKELDEQLRKLPMVDAPLLAELDELDRKVQAEKSTLKAIATRIEVLGAGLAVTLDGKTLDAGAEETLSDPAELVVGADTTIRITPGGGQSIADVRVLLANLEGQLATGLTSLGLANVAAVRQTLDERTKAESQRHQRLSAIEALDGDKVRLQFEEVTEKLETVEAEITRKLPAGYERPADVAALATLKEAVETRCQKAGDASKAAEAALEVANAVLEEAQRKRAAADDAVATQRGEAQRLQGRKEALEQQHGANREQLLQELAATKKTTQDALNETNRALAKKRPDEVRADVDRLTRAIEKEKKHIAQSRERQAEARGQLRQVGTFDLHTVKAEADAQLAAANRRHAEAERRATALDHLRKLFDARRREVAARFAEPLRKKVEEYLDALYGGGSRVGVTVTDDGFEGFRVARPTVGGFDFGFASLSGGTREQVAAAARLAMAELLAGEETVEGDSEAAPGCLPMVFDDAFTNSDPNRLKAVQRVLDLGARRGLQIIVLTCNPADYGQLAASKIFLPPADFGPPLQPAALDGLSAGRDDDGNEGDDDGEAGDEVGTAGPGTGQVPEGTDDELAATFLSALADAPDRKAGNVSLRGQLRWDEDTYERIKDRLIAAGRLKKGKGRGGSVYLPDDGEPPA
jgi:DNA repair exonuclease SbcCD ATPase subunit